MGKESGKASRLRVVVVVVVGPWLDLSLGASIPHLGQTIVPLYSTTVHDLDPPGRADLFLICTI